MSRINPVSTEKAPANVKEIYSNIQKKVGSVPNIFQLMGNSEQILKGYLALSEACEHTSLNPKLREQIALVVSQTNQCQYCLSAHSLIAKKAGLADQEILLARKGEASDAKTKAILKFSQLVTENRGHATDRDVSELKSAGVSDVELVEIILVINTTIFTNYFNHITDPTNDFPPVKELY